MMQKTMKDIQLIRAKSTPVLIELTCPWAPEQYDFFIKDSARGGTETTWVMCGYLRARHGYWSFTVPGVLGEELTGGDLGDAWDSNLPDNERQKILENCAELMVEWYHKHADKSKSVLENIIEMREKAEKEYSW